MLLGQCQAAGLIDEAHIYIGAKLFGGRDALGPIGDPGIDAVADATTLRLDAIEKLDQDVKLTYRRA